MFLDSFRSPRAAVEPAAPTAAAMRRTERALLFLFGAVGYGLLEIAWRGYTHWSMLLCGGIALLMLRSLSKTSFPFGLQCAAGALGITGLELIAGVIVNRWLGLAVWDYRDQWGNLWGQICPAFTLLWLVLAAPVLAVLRTLPEWQGDAQTTPKEE